MVNFIINIYTLPDNSHYMSCCVVLSRRVPHMGNYNITAGKNNACTWDTCLHCDSSRYLLTM